MARGNRDLPEQIGEPTESRETVSLAIGGGEARPPRAAPSTNKTVAEIGPGDCVGRYTIRALIGAGGMGRVFAAVDPQLGRTVAIKLIRAEHSPAPHARARLMREAQALAKLHHPNVVTVHDVGTQGGELFVAMEHIAGATLRDWLAATPRRWRETLATFLAAGRGLAAAHAAGIVHRDFKPANVIVGGDRVVVVDFGLARAGDDDDEPGAPSDGLKVSVTLTGEHVGTPRYMAPEQRAGGPITPKADQYSFCVALWEALHGERPPGTGRADVPGFLDSALGRGLAQDPEQRWPSMDALLAALSHDPARRRQQIAVAAAVVALCGVVAWSALRARANPCLGASARLAGVWDTPRKEAVRRAFLATGIPYAEDTWQRVSARLDAYTAGWADMHSEACRATRVEGRQSDTLMDLRMSCLESDRVLLGALSGLWAGGMDKETLNAAIDAAGGLPPVAECADTRTLTERVRLPADRAQAARIATARAHLDEVQAMILAHRWADARKQVTAVRVEADATGWPQVRAEAAFAEADVLHDLSDPSAEVPFLEAHRLAALAHDDRLAARALIELVKTLAVDDQHADRALMVADVAAGAVARAGDAPGLRGQLLAHRAEALFTKNNFDAAHEAFASAQKYLTEALGPDDSLTLWNEAELARTMGAQGQAVEARHLLEANLEHTIRVLGAEHPTVASKLNNLGLMAWGLGDYEGAAAQFRRALAIKERVGGADAAWSARTLSNLAGVEGDLNHLDVARDLEERALTIRERMFGTEHAQVALSLKHLASFRRKEGRYAQALELLHRALAIETKTLGPNDRAVVDTLADIADVLDTEGDRAGALDYYRRALDVLRRSAGPDHPDALHLTNRVADELALLHRCDEARPLLATSTTGLEKTLGPDSPYVGEALAATAECDLAAGHAAQAVANLERAIAIEEKSDGPPVDRGSYRWLLARSLWSLGRHDEARAAAQKAEQELDGDADGARDCAAARAWLASHQR